MDRHLVLLLVRRLSHRDAAELLTVEERGDTDRLRVEADALRTRQDDLAALVAEVGGMTVQQFKVANARLIERLAMVESELAEAGRTSILTAIVTPGDEAAVAARWEAMTLTQKKAVVRALAGRIELVPVGAGAHHRDEAGLKIAWRVEMDEM